MRSRTSRWFTTGRRLVRNACTWADTPTGKMLLWVLGTALNILVRHLTG
ncbi:hypothetical protein HLK59_16260 [Streptomyces sp. S3(2020)]|nr:hypothetical protein [Streptomyces sp. S3(2020)]NNN31892.1 hypothetical protein [Streptomyces sp. S3(2020)]